MYAVKWKGMQKRAVYLRLVRQRTGHRYTAPFCRLCFTVCSEAVWKEWEYTQTELRKVFPQ